MAGSRPPEMEDWLNSRIYHPLSHRVAAAFKPTPVTPNIVSLLGGAMIVLAGIFYVGLSAPLSVALGFLAHALWHVFDGADGELARATGKTSPLGEVIDGACDYVGHFILYHILGIALFLEGRAGHWIWPLGYLSGLSRVVQANHVESLRRTYLWRAYGIPWLKQAQASGGALDGSAGPAARLLAPAAKAYVALAAAVIPTSDRIDRIFVEVAGDPERLERAREICRARFRRPLSHALLGPNLRTAALGLSMAAGSPLWYFLCEGVLLNLVLLSSILGQRKADEALADALEAEFRPHPQPLSAST